MHDIISFLFRALKTTCRCFAPPVLLCACVKNAILITSASAKLHKLHWHYLGFRSVKKWKRVGRALGVEDPVLESIGLENDSNISECSFQMLTSWLEKSAPQEATYRKLVQALLDNTVGLRNVVEHHCLLLNGKPFLS